MNNYTNTNNLPLLNVSTSTRTNNLNGINKTAINGYGSLATSGYQQSSNRGQDVTKSQKDLINRSYEFKNDTLMTRYGFII
jgi:hypothetical protein